MRKGLIVLAAVSLAAATACGGGNRKVSRMSANTTTDLSGKWNDTDARLTAEALIQDCFGSAWLPNHLEEHSGEKPAVTVGRIVNKSDEQIDGQVFTKNIERAMVNSGKVRVLAQRDGELDEVMAEQDLGMSGRVADDSAPSVGNMRGADYVIVGRISSITDQVGGEATKFYQINFELLNTTTRDKVWVGEHKIKKAISQASASW